MSGGIVPLRLLSQRVLLAVSSQLLQPLLFVHKSTFVDEAIATSDSLSSGCVNALTVERQKKARNAERERIVVVERNLLW